jgi:hypothetical protein
MNHYVLNNAQKAATGFTDLFVIKYTDWIESTNDTDEAITLIDCGLGDFLDNRVLVEVKTNVAGLTTCNGLVSIASDGTLTTTATAVVASSNLLAAGSEYYTGAESVPHICITDTTSNVVFIADPGTNTQSTADEATAGEIWIWLNYSRAADRLIQA